MDERLTEEGIGERAQRIRLALAGLHLEDAAMVCQAARIVREDSKEFNARLGDFKLQASLLEERPDPRNIALAMKYGEQESAQAWASGVTVNITDYRVKDASLARIVSECDEKVLEDVCAAIADRAVKTKANSPALPVLRVLWTVLNEVFKSARKR